MILHKCFFCIKLLMNEDNYGNNKDKEIQNSKIILGIIIGITLFMAFILWITKGGDYRLYYTGLASLLAGMIGSIGTLMAVIITTKQKEFKNRI